MPNMINPQKGIWSITMPDMINPQKGIWSITMPDMMNPQKGIDLMNNNSIINRILFVVTIFQHSPLTRRVFYNIIRREREGNNIWSTD
jgi:hypothetical protein